MIHFDDAREEDPNAKIDRILAKHGAATGHGITALQGPRTPLDSLIAKEEGEPEDSYAIRRETLLGLMSFFFQSGPDPREVVQNVFAIATALDHPAVVNLTLEDQAGLFGNGRAAMSWRVKKLYNATLEKAGFKGTHAKRQKRATTCEKYRQAQLGNHNRRQSKRPPRDLGLLLSN